MGDPPGAAGLAGTNLADRAGRRSAAKQSTTRCSSCLCRRRSYRRVQRFAGSVLFNSVESGPDGAARPRSRLIKANGNKGQQNKRSCQASAERKIRAGRVVHDVSPLTTVANRLVWIRSYPAVGTPLSHRRSCIWSILPRALCVACFGRHAQPILGNSVAVRTDDRELKMANDRGMEAHQKSEQQTIDKDRAQTSHTTDEGKIPPKEIDEDDQPNKTSVPG